MRDYKNIGITGNFGEGGLTKSARAALRANQNRAAHDLLDIAVRYIAQGNTIEQVESDLSRIKAANERDFDEIAVETLLEAVHAYRTGVSEPAEDLSRRLAIRHEILVATEEGTHVDMSRDEFCDLGSWKPLVDDGVTYHYDRRIGPQIAVNVWLSQNDGHCWKWSATNICSTLHECAHDLRYDGIYSTPEEAVAEAYDALVERGWIGGKGE